MTRCLPFLFLLQLLASGFPGHCQQMVSGTVLDSATRKPLPYVNIGIKRKNEGTVSLPNGTFSIRLRNAGPADTLTFSLVGHHEWKVPVAALTAGQPLTVRLAQRVIALDEIKVSGTRPVEQKFGIRKRNLLLHFTDGMFSKSDVFEIAQAIRLGNRTARITSVNLHINAGRRDSASFRINFYRLEDDRPGERIVEKSILQRHPIREGWLKFDLTAHKIVLKGDFVVAVEFIPESNTPADSPIYYEVRLGGSSRSFYRKNSLGQWNIPPHHYCLHLTALVDRAAPPDGDDEESVPEFRYPSGSVKDTFSLFVRLPTGYRKKPEQRYPVVYHLDGNAYFDPISYSVTRLARKKKLRTEPIVVGIGYRDAYRMDSLRVRDYTYPAALPSDSLPSGGGGEKFYDFIKNELIPEIDRRYRTDGRNRTLMGHSFGGFFTLYALLRQIDSGPVFSHFVAASPSLWYHDGYLQKALEAAGGPDPARSEYRLFLSVGEQELAGDQRETVAAFGRRLQQHAAVRFWVYEQLEHMGTAVPSFEDGIEYIFGK
ncbi:alpha/beta hydrolase-fold protein [Larkinella soli]|uniref:alpha/beta hydrolase-fold protein n=1 Tax=Larkinella soli TaxID=1770527 RepID=UPI000FFBF4C9|nr:alpha/beta hydrolase-fold protein [Larkinella soli]